MERDQVREDSGWLHPDEPCWELKETDRIGSDFLEHRIQEVIVVRNGKPVSFEADLGYSWNFTCGDFNIWGGLNNRYTGQTEILHTVGELMEYAEEMRQRRPTSMGQEFIETAGEKLLDQLQKAVYEGNAQQTKQSVFGPAVTKVRN